ncbi:PIN domain-containing protein [Microbacterium schleiferi]|uniref:Ribonuclease VapC n=1 Tax=Microbacterium schleiferi TaxID=69362 RepID=A0A7S8MVR5_9MICO|nr:PIN domain-containing protein [Microbacterium schleiferi]QPE04159.1 PIN domain-containing protein [Microbacterium schleiferi]
MTGLLDTSVLIGPIPAAVIEGIERYVAPYLVRAELLRGQRRFELSPNMRQRAAARAQLIAALDDLHGFWRPFGSAESDAYAQLRASSEQAVQSKDAIIAAHAIAAGQTLVTADRGFTRFQGLEVDLI